MILGNPANASIIAHLRARMPRSIASASPTSVDPWQLGTHPDLVEYLWTTLGDSLPRTCDWVVYGSPTLVHPSVGVVFAFAGGTDTLAMRLPEPELSASLAVPKYGPIPELPGWALVHAFFEPNAEGWLLRAFDHAQATSTSL
jgi:hypothetical protein